MGFSSFQPSIVSISGTVSVSGTVTGSVSISGTGSITGSVLVFGSVTASQGTPNNSLSAAWPVLLCSGSSPFGTDSNPIVNRAQTQFVRTSGWESPTGTLSASAVYDVASHQIDPNYSTRMGDATCARITDTQVALTSSFTITTNQICRLIVNTGTEVRKLEQGHDGVYLNLSAGSSPYTLSVTGSGAQPVPAGSVVDVSWFGPTKGVKAEDVAHADADYGVVGLRVRRDVCTSSAGASGDYVVANQDADGFDYVVDKSRDSALNAQRVLIVNPQPGYRVETPVPLISSGQGITNAWVDLGPEINTSGMNRLRLWLNVTKGDGTVTTIRTRALFKHTSAGAEEYPSSINNTVVSAVPYVTTMDDETFTPFAVDATATRTILWNLDNTVPFVQLQISASTPGTSMTASTAYVTLGYN